MGIRMTIRAATAATLMIGLLSSSPSFAEDFIIGLGGPYTGSAASFGEQFRHGGELAVADLNAKGGILGRKVVVVLGDDGSDPKQGVSMANDLLSKNINAYIGDFNSGVSIPVSDITHEEGIVQISPASTNPLYTDRGYDNVFRDCGRDDKQGLIAGNYLATSMKGKNVAILNDKSAYGKGLADETEKAYRAAGGKPVMVESITAGEKDYSALISKLKSAKVDVIYFGGYQIEAGLITRQAREQGMTAVLMGGDALTSSEFWSITGAAGAGTLFTFEPDWRKAATAKPLVERFKATGYEPEGYTLNTYAAFQIVAQAAEQAKSVKPADLIKALHSATFNTVLGPIAFDAKGDLKDPKYVFYRWENGNYAEIE